MAIQLLEEFAGEGEQFEGLQDEVNQSKQGARMVLPGIQAVFGFQLVAIFSDGFKTLPKNQQYIHLAALLSVAVSVMMVLTPAAYRRQAEPGRISRSLAE